MAKLDALLVTLGSGRGSTLHLAAEMRPRIRRHGALREIEGSEPMTGVEVTEMLSEVAGEAAWERYCTHYTLEFGYELSGTGRFRIHCFHRRAGTAAVIRTAPEVRRADELGLPASAQKLAQSSRGLVIVAGPPGSGKSTTIAALLAEIGETTGKHVITLEDPVEYVHDARYTFSQREVGTHCRDQVGALRAALLQSPDAIMLNEPTTMAAADAAIDVAEAGVLVFMEITANGAVRALERLIGLFDADRQSSARNRIGEAFSGILSQLLIPSADGRENCLACEVVLRSRSVPAMIRDGDFSGLDTLVRRSEQMQTMDDALKALLSRHKISADDAYEHARDKSRFE